MWSRRCASWLGLLGVAAAAVACPSGSHPVGPDAEGESTSGGDPLEPLPPAVDPLQIAYDAAIFDPKGKLLARLKANPFAYFRYLAGPFAKTVCEGYAGSLEKMPTVSLHGDAHLEQYAVADDGFGIVDFDDATKGPPVLDWLRFSTSLWLAWPSEPGAVEEAIRQFVAGYRQGLNDPRAVLRAPEPAVARRIRARFDASPSEWLDRVSGLMQPLDEMGQHKMNQARDRYIAAIRAQNPDLSEAFFALKKGGALQMGIGSAHETKFLVRVEGPSTAAADDVILEKKQMKAQLLGPCVRGDAADPRRVISAQAKFSRSPQRFLGYVEVDTQPFYVQAWRVHYTELRVADIQSGAELAELAHDFGLQLGRGHPLYPDSAEDGARERREIAAALDAVEPELIRTSRDLAERTVRAFDHFRGTCPVEAAARSH